MPFIQFTLLFASAAMQPASSAKDRVEAGKKRFNDKWRAGFTASLMYWPFINTIMYAAVKPRFMNLYADMAGLCFATIMSFIMYQDNGAQEKESAQIVQSFALEIPQLPQLSSPEVPSTLLLEAVTTLPLMWRNHLRFLMHNGTTVEAEAAKTDEKSVDEMHWLLSTQT